MRKILTKSLVLIFSVGMLVSLVMNFFLQSYLNRKNFLKNAQERFIQIERIMTEKEQELKKVKEEFSEDCIVRARAAAYMAQVFPEIIENQEECKRAAELLQVDELHFFNPEGEIYAGTNPKYYGYNFHSGEQMEFFLPMLQDSSMELCQDITPNTAEQKLMQYAAVWRSDKKGIVQVGLEPTRVLDAIGKKSVASVFSMLSVDVYEDFFAVDSDSGVIIDATQPEKIEKKLEELGGLKKEDIGTGITWGKMVLDDGIRYSYAAKRINHLILVKICPAFVLYRDVVQNTLLLCVYFLVLFLLLIISSYIFVERKILRPIFNINRKLKKIGQGNWDIVLEENSAQEFAELSSYINAMVVSLIDFPKKISKALERSEVPIGICEYIPSTNQFTATSRVAEILRLSDREIEGFAENPKLFEKKLHELTDKQKCLRDNIYSLGEEPKHYIRIESFEHQNSRMTTLIDVTSEILEQQKLVRERDTDLLTGLYNRRAFYREIESLFSKKEVLQTAVMIMADLDKLKMVNDKYGHEAGDRYLKTFAEFVRCLEAPNKIVARMGGDEFILFLYGMQEEEIESVLRELSTYRGICPVYMDNGENVILEFSMGWAEYPQEGAGYPELIAKADERMYEEKNLRKEEREELKRDNG